MSPHAHAANVPLLQRLAAQVSPSVYPSGTLVDMFCAGGEAAQALAKAWRLAAVGVDINPALAREARGRLGRAIASDAFKILGTHGQFDAAYLDPPAALVETEAPAVKTVELVTRYLRPGGLLVALLPDRCLTAHRKVLALLTTQYEMLRVFRLPDPHFARHRTVAAYARRRRDPRRDPEAADRVWAEAIGRPAELPGQCPEPVALPDRPLGKRAYFRSDTIDAESLVDEVAAFRWRGAATLAALMAPPQAEPIGRPAMPFKRRHLGMLLSSAVLNNVALRQGGVTIVVCGRTHKLTEAKPIPVDREDADDPERVSQQFETEVEVYYPETGQFQSFQETESKEFVAFLETWREPLVAAVNRFFAPAYAFDFRQRFEPWLVEYVDRYVGERATIAGRRKTGLFEGQKHAFAAAWVKLHERLPGGKERNYFLYGGKPAVGKSMSAAALTGAFTREWALRTGHPMSAPGWRPSYVVTEPQHVNEMVREYRRADPLLRPRVVNTLADVNQFLDDAAVAPWPMVAVMARTRIKEGSGWRAAVLRRRTVQRLIAEDGARTSVPHAQFRCPECGAIQLVEDRTVDRALWPAVAEARYFTDRRRWCHDCQSPLWEDHREIGGKGYSVDFWECLQHWEHTRDETLLHEARRCGLDSETVARFDRARRVSEIACVLGRLDGRKSDFALQRGDRLFLVGARLVAQRDGRAVATLDLESGALVTGARVKRDHPAAGARVWRVPGPRRPNLTPPPVRMPVAEYLLRLVKHGRVVRTPQGPRRERVRFLVGVIDELHKYKGIDSNAGYAMANLMDVADKTVGMTGTPYGGYASTIFPLEYRSNPAFRARWPYGSVRAFVHRYGLLEWVERNKRDGDDEDDTLGYSDLSGYRRLKLGVHELPSVSPELTAYMLDHSLFISLQDLGFQMVPRIDTPVVVDPDEDLHKAYTAFVNDARAALKAARAQGVKLGGALLHAMLSYTSAPWRETMIRDRGTRTVWAWAPDLEMLCKHCGRTLFKDKHCNRCHPHAVPRACVGGCGVKHRRVFAKEQALLDRLLAAKRESRPALVYAIHTASLDIVTPRWTSPAGLCASHGIQAINGNGWPTDERARRFEQAVLSGVDAVFVNPRQVELSLNLIQYPDIHHYQTDYSLYTLEQASARSHRPTQTRDVNVHFYCTRGTYEYNALTRVAQKRYAADTFYGDAADSPLVAETGAASIDLMREIISTVATTDLPDLTDIFAEHNRLAAETPGPSEFVGAGGFEVETREREYGTGMEGPGEFGDGLPVNPGAQMRLFQF